LYSDVCLQEFGLRGRGKEQHRKQKQQPALAATAGDRALDGCSSADDSLHNISSDEKEVLASLADYIKACGAPQSLA
jgi:hypothetical protein